MWEGKNMCIRPWQGLLVHFEEKLPGANVVGSQAMLQKQPQNVGARIRSGHVTYRNCSEL